MFKTVKLFLNRLANIMKRTKKITAGDAARARWKRRRTAFSESPTHFEYSSGPLTARKFKPHSLANAFATRVLLQPGGPNNKRPFGGRIPNRTKSAARCKRKVIRKSISISILFCKDCHNNAKEYNDYKLNKSANLASD